jgi:alanyl-tRNA synthetase
MAEQRTRARAAWAGTGDAATERVWFEIREQTGATEFQGYTTETAEAQVLALVIGGMPVQRAETGDKVSVILNQTPFYAESGGQVGDTGTITGPGGLKIAITDTQKRAGDLFVHVGLVQSGEVSVGTPVRAELDHARRTAIRAHHSATHLLHEALRRRLGTHVAQKGSLNAPDRLRFDVSQPTPISRADLAAVEAEVNARIRENAEVTTRLMTPEAAVAEGAMALFGEKYGDEVRVVAMGEGDDTRLAYSIELCGGTHVRRTGDIGLFRITGEGAVSAGVRRVEAVTGAAALALLAESDRHMDAVATLLRASPAEIPARVTALIEDRKRLERTVSDLQRKLATGGGAPELEDIGGIQLAARNVGEVPGKELKGLVDAIAQQAGSGVVALVSTADTKLSIAVGVSSDLVKRISAIDLVRAASAAVGGKGGGGRPEMAQAGGPDPDRADDALDAIRAALAGHAA